jgi:hypothetical protein
MFLLEDQVPKFNLENYPTRSVSYQFPLINNTIIKL